MTDIELMGLIFRVNSEFKRVFHQEMDKRDYRGVKGSGRLLHQLEINGEMPQKELAKLLDIRPQSLTEALNKLETEGYISRCRSNVDKREQLVKITELGIEKGKLLREIRVSASGSMFSCLTESEKENLSVLLTKVLEQNIESMED